MIVTIDGPAGSGKSTAARRLAELLDFRFLDTGAMYRVVAFCCLRRDLDPQDEDAVGSIAEQVEIDFDADRVLVDRQDITSEIRTPEVTQTASFVAALPRVRRAMVEQQRRLASGRDVVSEGRDQGTEVFPEAECKFFLTASPEVRAERRHAEFVQKGLSSSVEQTLAAIRDRDQRDESRSISPLRPAEDAEQVDTSSLTIDGVVRLLIERIESRRGD